MLRSLWDVSETREIECFGEDVDEEFDRRLLRRNDLIMFCTLKEFGASWVGDLTFVTMRKETPVHHLQVGGCERKKQGAFSSRLGNSKGHLEGFETV
ncbi:hypothetical protein QG37_04413 [Candidozyma auris]|uniref:Uncharacterized protein n=1 Tax=Candidozyma auris TaxID=498019 RepID=A0A0L0NWI9_CANAR|nr:hypothetical protein QG37_04413 [[Candida] auris]